MTARCTYVLPLKHADAGEGPELGAYLRTIAGHAQVIVVDGSAPDVFRAHAAALPPGIAHIPVDDDLRFAFGKVNGVLTGVRRAGHDAVVIADDDVRYTPELLATVVDLLGRADVVRPQNTFDSLPWHARWDTGRTLLNRAFGADWPGTLAVRRSLLHRAGGYDGDCLFENLELVRTIEAVGGRSLAASWVAVPRRPPSAQHFWSQRVRQAYDSFAQPWRLALELVALPCLGLATWRYGLPAVVVAVLATIAGAEVGRRRDGGTRMFPVTAPLWAPLWAAERSVTAWLALGSRVVLGGVPYGERRLRVAAHSKRELLSRTRRPVASPALAWSSRDRHPHRAAAVRLREAAIRSGRRGGAAMRPTSTPRV